MAYKRSSIVRINECIAPVAMSHPEFAMLPDLKAVKDVTMKSVINILVKNALATIPSLFGGGPSID
jgi:hypothetical protein